MGYKAGREDEREEIKENGFEVDEHLFQEEDLLNRIRQLTKPNQPYWICIMRDIADKPQN